MSTDKYLQKAEPWDVLGARMPLMSLRLTSADLERSLMVVNRQIARLQKEVDARRRVQMARAMEEAKALIARHGLNAKDLAEIEQGLRVGAAPVRTTPKNSKPVPAL